MNSCPTGFFCLDNNILIIVIIIVIYFVISYKRDKKDKKDIKNKIKEIKEIKEPPKTTEIIINNTSPVLEPSIEYQRITNPLLPPLRGYPYSGGVPINIPTRGYSVSYSQIGAIISNDIKHGNTESRIMPLFGKPTYPSSSKWMYYTIMDKYNAVKLPIISKNKQCLDDIGCNELYDGDKVSVVGNSGEFTANIYKIDYPTYIP